MTRPHVTFLFCFLLLLSVQASAAPPFGFVNEVIASGFVEPTAVAFLPDGSILIVERDGDIFIADPSANPVVPTPYMVVPDVEYTDQRGLFDITLDPNFGSNGFFYLYYTHAPSALHRIARFTHQGTFADPASEFVVWQDNEQWSGSGHIGGGLDFGPDDLLYLTTGDEDDGAQAQDLTRSGGKVIRVQSDGAVPVGNPHVDGPGPLDDYVFARGLRNPVRARWDLVEGRLYIADVGEDTIEEIHVGTTTADDNYAWADCEGICGSPYDDPIFTYPHDAVGGSVTGGYVNRSFGFPGIYSGVYFYADFVQGWIRYLEFDGLGNVVASHDFDPNVGANSVVFLDGAPDGSMYYIEYFTGNIRRVSFPGALTFSDDFDRAGLGSNWVVDSGSYAISANQLIENSNLNFTDAQMRWAGGETTVSDQFSKLQITKTGSHTFGFMLRTNDPSGMHYEVHRPIGDLEWRWELYDPSYVERIGQCTGSQPLQDGDWIGTRVEGAGPSTLVSVWHWGSDPGAISNWGQPDCQMSQAPSTYVDSGGGLGIRYYTGDNKVDGIADNWSAGQLFPAGVCGNSLIEPGEECDDGGESINCDANCTFAACGDGTFNPAAEQCEMNIDCSAGEVCDGTCACVPAPVCGNGFVEFGEECDDAGESASCDTDCTFSVCGDLTVNPSAGETCETSAQCASGESCQACGCAPGPPIFTDDFNRVSLGPDWAIDSGNFQISSNQLVETSGTKFVNAQMRWFGGDTQTADQHAKLQIINPSSRMFGFMSRVGDPSGMHYEIHLPAGSTEWRWELNDPNFVERIGDCVGDQVLSPGDWIGSTVEGAGSFTVVSVWRWGSDPGNDPTGWGPPDCQMTQDPSPSVDSGKGLGIRTYTGNSTASGFADNWSAGSLGAPSSCGNGVVDNGEECDDAGPSSACDNDCTFAACGDGLFNPLAEQCEVDADCSSGDICDGGCACIAPPICGNGVAEFGEECDDAGASATCDIDCTFAICGDNIFNPQAEECEVDADCLSGDICDGGCACIPPPICGNGIAEFGEECDDAGESATCDADCTFAVCGDLTLNPSAGEMCEFDNQCSAGESCSSCACGPPGATFSDDFNRATLGPDWTVDSGIYNVTSNRLVQGSGTMYLDAQLRYTAASTDGPDQYSKLQVVSLASHSYGFMFRTNDPSGLHYEVHLGNGGSEWRWELYDPGYVTRVGDCQGGGAVSDGDWIGARIDGQGTDTLVSVWRWETDPGGHESWGTPSCQMTQDPTTAVDFGTGLGIRSYTGNSLASSSADNWSGGDVLTPPPVVSGWVITRILGNDGAGTPNSMVDPDGVTVDSLGNVYVGACGLGPNDQGVFKIAPDLQVTKIMGSDGDGVNDADCPVGVVLDADNNLYVAAFLSNNVFKITPAGIITEIMNSSGAGTPDSLQGTLDVEVDSAGNVYATAYSTDRVFKRTPSGTVTEVLGPNGDGAGTSLDQPFGLAVDSNDNIYVAGIGIGSDAVFQVTPMGIVSVVIDASGDGNGNTLAAPHALAVDLDDNLYVTGNESDNVFKITPANEISMILDSTGDGQGNIMDNPTGVATDAAGNVYVNAFFSHNLFQITPGGLVTQILDESGDGTNDFQFPADVGLSTDAAGNVYSAGTDADNVFKISPMP